METKANQSVLVVFDDDLSRDAAVDFCDRLVSQFWTECGFDVNWCSFVALADPKQAAKSAVTAASADVLVFAVQPEGVLPVEVRRWIDGWVTLRSDREGVVIGLLDPARKGSDYMNKYTWLREAAHRAGLDYLTEAPQMVFGVAGSFAAVADRASKVTSVLDEILHQPVRRSGSTPL